MCIHIYSWPISVAVWQKPAQRCKAIILQLKNKNKVNSKRKKKKGTWNRKRSGVRAEACPSPSRLPSGRRGWHP